MRLGAYSIKIAFCISLTALLGQAPVMGVTPAPPDISKALAFEDPSLCSSMALERFFAQAEKSGTAMLGSLGRVAVTRIKLPARGAVKRQAIIRAGWNGLTLVSLEYVTMPDSENTQVQIYRLIFAERGSASGPVLKKIGFGVGTTGQEREIYDENTMMNPYFIALEQQGTGSALKCTF